MSHNWGMLQQPQASQESPRGLPTAGVLGKLMTAHTVHHLFSLPSSCLFTYLEHNHTLTLWKTNKNTNRRVTFTFATFPLLSAQVFSSLPPRCLPAEPSRALSCPTCSTGFSLLMTSMLGVFLSKNLHLFIDWKKEKPHKCLVCFYSPPSSRQWATHLVEHQPIRRGWEGKGLWVLWSPNTGHSPQSRWQFWMFLKMVVPHNPLWFHQEAFGIQQEELLYNLWSAGSHPCLYLLFKINSNG